MENQKQETKLKISKSQLQTIINTHIQEEKGLNIIFSMMVNGLMLSERNTFLNEANDNLNKGNGYGHAHKAGTGFKLQLEIVLECFSQ